MHPSFCQAAANKLFSDSSSDVRGFISDVCGFISDVRDSSSGR